MESETLRRIHGGVRLAADAVEGATGAAAQLQRAIVQQIYEPFALLGPLAPPVQLIAQFQTAITDQVYASVLGVNRLIAGGALALLERQIEAEALNPDGCASAADPTSEQPQQPGAAHRPQGEK